MVTPPVRLVKYDDLDLEPSVGTRKPAWYARSTILSVFTSILVPTGHASCRLDALYIHIIQEKG